MPVPRESREDPLVRTLFTPTDLEQGAAELVCDVGTRIPPAGEGRDKGLPGGAGCGLLGRGRVARVAEGGLGKGAGGGTAVVQGMRLGNFTSGLRVVVGSLPGSVGEARGLVCVSGRQSCPRDREGGTGDKRTSRETAASVVTSRYEALDEVVLQVGVTVVTLARPLSSSPPLKTETRGALGLTQQGSS